MSTVDPIRNQTLTYFLRPGDPAPSRPAALFLALFTADPGSGGGATNELAANGYSRQPIAFDTPTDGETQDAGTVTFGPAGSGGWPQVTHIAVCTGATTGGADLLYAGALQTPVTLAAGQSLRIDTGQLIVVGGSATVDANAVVLAAAGTRLFSYVVGDSLAGAAISRNSIATYFDANGVLQTASANVLRDAHYEHGIRTLLLEPQATNRALQSENLSDPFWSEQGSHIASDATAGPDGAVTADKLVEDAVAARHSVEHFWTDLPDNALSTHSIFVKAAERTKCLIEHPGKDAVNHRLWFDLAAGQFLTVDPNWTPRARALANGWYRIVGTINVGTGADDVGFDVRSAITDGATSYTGDGTSGIYVTGADAKAGPASSYVPTTAAEATREADLVSWAYSFAPQESSGLIRFSEMGGASIAGAGVLYLGNDQETGPRLWIDATGSGYRLVHDNGTGQVESAVAMAPAFGDSVALRWVLYDDGSVELFQSVNGGAETSGGRSAANVLAAAWGGQILRLNSVGTGNVGLAGYTKCVVDTGVQSLVTLDSPALPAAPSALSATANATTVTLTWTDNAANETGFHIYRKYTSPDGTYTDPDWVLINSGDPVPADTTEYDDTGLTVGATYHYYVTSFNTAGESAPSNTVDITIPSGGGSVPAAPTGLTATAISASRIDLAWTDNATDETGYEVHRSTVSGFTPSSSNLVQSLAAGSENWSDQTVTASTAYYYRVLAVNDAGASSPSNEASATTPATASFAHEPAGMTLMTDQPWLPPLPPNDYSANDAHGWRRQDPDNHLTIVSDQTVPMGSTYLNMAYPQGFHAGSGPGLVAFEDSLAQVSNKAELFLGTNLWVSPGAIVQSANIWKLWYVFQEIWSPSYNRQATWIALRSSNGRDAPFRVAMNQEAAGAGAWLEHNGSGPTYAITTGVWHKIEVYMKRSSGDGVADGIFRMWVDDVLYMDYSTVKYNDELFTQWHVDGVWGGNGTDSTPAAQSLRFDRMYLSGK